jgi:hypothetical protein
MLIMLVNILVNSDEERYGDALEYAIYNFERIKQMGADEKNEFSQQILSRAYEVLGFCYSKISDFTPYHEDKFQSIQLALSCFKEVNEVNIFII